ncbi:MAG: DNA cytosine methyltransferase [Desmonostoc geniculatum HA4340-LM1]|nr:DNA cytosine methyltransferase [Desmonostoc geniculatum HA4340-LM1]
MRQAIRAIGLFEGIGGFCRAAQLVGGFEWVESVEIDDDAAQVLRDNFGHHIHHGDIRDYHPTPGAADLYTIGFPCNNTSNAGDRTGLLGEKSGLWLEALRCIVEGLPQFVVIEQPEGILHRGLRAILGGLRMAGYAWDDPILLQAEEIGACQHRTRVFVVAYLNSLQWQNFPSVWLDQVRSHCQEARADIRFPIIEHRDDGCNLRIPPELDGVPIGVEEREQRGRLQSRFVYGRTVIPQQAAIALRRVKYFHSLISTGATVAESEVDRPQRGNTIKGC